LVSLLGPFTAWGRGQSEDRLLAAAQAGEKDAFDRLARIHQRALRGYVARRVGPDAAEDVLQETWLAVWNALRELRGRSRFKAWVFGIAAHKCTDYLRARGRSATVDAPAAFDQAVNPAGRDPYAAAELKHIVDAALFKLPENQREVLEMYYYAELTLPEIAELLGRNLNTVKYQFYRAHAQVAAQLQEAESGESMILGRGDGRP